MARLEGSLCDALRDLVPFVQFKKLKIRPWRSVTFSKSNTPLWVLFTFYKLYKWYQIAQRITYITYNTLGFHFSHIGTPHRNLKSKPHDFLFCVLRKRLLIMWEQIGKCHQSSQYDFDQLQCRCMSFMKNRKSWKRRSFESSLKTRKSNK